jgi:hypothetical protein
MTSCNVPFVLHDDLRLISLKQIMFSNLLDQTLMKGLLNKVLKTGLFLCEPPSKM